SSPSSRLGAAYRRGTDRSTRTRRASSHLSNSFGAAEAPRMEASMDQSGKGSRFRRVLPFALAGVGAYAALALGSSTVITAPTPTLAPRRTPAAQTVRAADPLPVAGTVGQVGRDVLPGDAAAATGSLSDPTSALAGSTAASTNPGPVQPGGLPSGIPVVDSL